MKLVIAEKPMLARDIARAICGRSEQIISTGGRDPACFLLQIKKKVLTRCVPYGMIRS